MATYLYCVRGDDVGVPLGLAGIDGAPVRSLAAASLTAWVSDAEDTSVTVTVERVTAHDTVCAAALLAGDTPLPIRFGQAFADDRAAVDAIAARRAQLESRLARVSGCVELRVVVTRGRDAASTRAGSAEDAESGPPAGSDAVEGPGTAFLRRLARAGRADLAREVGCESVRHVVRDAARALLVDQQPCEAARGVSFFPVLVRRGNVADFRLAVAEILSSQAIDLSVLGPFAPYSFAADA
jgi:hypothetical protein